MRRFEDVVLNQNGQPVPNANVSVFLPGTSTTATLYSNDGLTVIPNPVLTNALGVFSFFVASGKYDFQVSGGNIATYTQTNVQIDDVFEFKVTDTQPWQTQTLEFNNQSSGLTPPTGNVNLYSKVSDKNLYYKDDTGREVGPLSGGGGVPSAPLNSIQKNSGGVFGSANATDNGVTFAINEETQFKGPVPWYDLRAYGGTTSIQTTTANCTSGSPAVTLAAAQDFVNGHGIVVYRCGQPTSLTTPQIPTVTSSVTGSTSYNYCLVAEDRTGGLTSCSPVGATTTGPAVLNKFGTAIALTQVSNAAGVATYTCSSNCNLSVNFPVNITGFANLDNGVRMITGTPTSNTFTTFTANTDGTTVFSGAATPFSANVLNFAAGSYSGNNTLRYWVYRNNALAGVAVGLDPYYVDFNQGVGFNFPSYVPLTAPIAAQNGFLASTISSGGGTTSLTLAKNAGATTSGQTVLHDNSAPLLNLMQTAFYNTPSTLGPPIYLASGLSFNSTTDMVNGISTGGFVSAKLILGGSITLNQPWIMRAGVRVEGGQAATSNTAFQADAAASITLNSHPGFYILPGSSGAGGYNYSNIIFSSPNVNNPYTAIYADLNSGGGGVPGIILTNINAISRGVSSVIMKGAFGNIINGGTLSGDFFVPPLRLTNSSVAVTGAALNSQAPGNTTINGTFFGGVGVQVDCLPNPAHCSGGGDVVLRDSLMENVAGPLMAVYATGSNASGGMAIINSQVADYQVGGGTPVLDSGLGVTLGVVNLTGVFFGQTLFLGSTGINIQSGASTTLIATGTSGIISSTIPYVVYGAGATYFNNNAAIALNGGRFLIPINTPAAPLSAVVSAGGAVPVDTYQYWITVQDIDGFESIIGPSITGITTTPGNQTVTVTRPVLPAGAVSWFIYRQGIVGGRSRVVCGATAAGVLTIVDNQSITCGNSSPNTSFAASTAFSGNGIYTNNFRLANSGFTGAFSPATLTASRTYSLSDVSGTFAFKDVAQTWTASQTLQGNIFSTGVAFASLGTPANGALIYCSDCTIANPCASGGTGALAKRLNSIWVCN